MFKSIKSTLLDIFFEIKILDHLVDNEISKNRINEGYDHLNKYLQNNSNLNLTVSSNLYVDQGSQILAKFIQSLLHFFRQAPVVVDFSESEVASERINNDVAEQTNNLITEVLVLSTYLTISCVL